MSVIIPPLRERKEDIRELAVRFLATNAGKAGRSTPGLSADGMRLIEEYRWPGNVRELRNIMERALAFCRGQELTARDLVNAAVELEASEVMASTMAPDTTGRMAPIDVTSGFRAPPSSPTLPRMKAAPHEASDLRSGRESFEKERIVTTLAKTAGNQKRAAELLGVSRRTLVTKLEQYGIERPRKG